jgi:hypothetical protein
MQFADIKNDVAFLKVMLRTNITLRNVSSIRVSALLLWHYQKMMLLF